MRRGKDRNMISVDRPTERRTARVQYAAVALTGTALLYLVIDDKWLFAVLVPALLLVALYRSWNVERLSPTLAQFYGHAVVAGAADRMAEEFRADRWLADSWADAPLARLLALPPGRIASGMAAVRAAGPWSRPLSAAGQAVNRGAAALFGLTCGAALGWGGFARTWQVVFGTALIVGFRIVVARHNRRQLAQVVATMRGNPRNELRALLGPPWVDRRTAIAAELTRLVDGPGPRRMPELRVIELLMGGGVVAGLLVGWAVR